MAASASTTSSAAIAVTAESIQHIGDAGQSCATLFGRGGDRLLEPLSGTQVRAADERLEHGQRAIGQRDPEFAQRRHHDGVPAGRSHLLKSLRRIEAALLRHLHHAGFEAGTRNNNIAANRADQGELVEEFEKRPPPDPRGRLAQPRQPALADMHLIRQKRIKLQTLRIR
jgi:hypothetical protein